MHDELLSMLRAEAQYDYIGFWEVIEEIILLKPDEPAADVKSMTLDLVAEMLGAGFLAVDLADNGGYRPWESQEPQQVLARIDSAWRALGREPNIGDIVWFTIAQKRA